eukprot:XP_016870704.1 netrin-G2 isoform X7 [Homo sapiens]
MRPEARWCLVGTTRKTELGLVGKPTCATTTSCCARTEAPACRTSAAPARAATPACAASSPAATPPTMTAVWTATARPGPPRAPPPCSAACCCWGWPPAWAAEPRPEDAPRTRRPGVPGSRGGAGVRGRAVRRVRPEVLPGATQQGPPPGPRSRPHCPPPAAGAPWDSGPRACDLVSFFFCIIRRPVPFLSFSLSLFFFFFLAVSQRVGRNAARPTPRPASHHTYTHGTVADTPWPVPGSRAAADPDLQLPTIPVADLVLFSILYFSCNPPDPRPHRRPGDHGTHRLGEEERRKGWGAWKLRSVENYFCLYSLSPARGTGREHWSPRGPMVENPRSKEFAHCCLHGLFSFCVGDGGQVWGLQRNPQHSLKETVSLLGPPFPWAFLWIPAGSAPSPQAWLAEFSTPRPGCRCPTC